MLYGIRWDPLQLIETQAGSSTGGGFLVGSRFYWGFAFLGAEHRQFNFKCQQQKFFIFIRNLPSLGWEFFQQVRLGEEMEVGVETSFRPRID